MSKNRLSLGEHGPADEKDSRNYLDVHSRHSAATPRKQIPHISRGHRTFTAGGPSVHGAGPRRRQYDARPCQCGPWHPPPAPVGCPEYNGTRARRQDRCLSKHCSESDRPTGTRRRYHGLITRKINYEAANLPLQVLFLITAPPTERSEAVEDLLEIKGVVDIRETLTGRRNLYVEAIGTTTTDITRMTDALHDLGLEIESSDILKQHRRQPFDHFRYEGSLTGEKVEKNWDNRE